MESNFWQSSSQKEAAKAAAAVCLSLTLEYLAYLAGRPIYAAFKNSSHGPMIGDVLNLTKELITLALVVYLIRLYKLPFSPIPKQKKTPALHRLKTVVEFILVNYGSLLIAGLAAMMLKKYLGFSSETHSPLETRQALYAEHTNLVFSIISVSVAGPILEELLFRCLVGQQLRKLFSLWATLLISAFVFALAHFQGMAWSRLSAFASMDLVPLAIMGLTFGMLFFRYGLVAAIVGHALFNSKSWFQGYFLEQPILFGILGIMGILAWISVFITQIRGTHE